MTRPLPPDDNDALPDDAELRALYRQLPQNEPGPALDMAVLRMAARALAGDAPSDPQADIRVTESPLAALRSAGNDAHEPSAGDAPQRIQRRPRWLVPLSSAASLIVVAGLAWHLHTLPPAESSLTSAVGAASTTAAPSELVSQTSPSLPAPLPETAAPLPVLQEMETAATKPLTTPKQSRSGTGAPPSKSAMQVAAAAATERELAARAARQRVAAASQSQAISIQAKALVTASTPAIQAAPQQQDALVQAAKSRPAEVTALSYRLSAPVSGVAAPAAAPAPAPVPPPAPLAAAPTADMEDASTQELDEIRQLIAKGDNHEAHQRLGNFRHAHPDLKLPEDLQAWLHQP